MGKGITSLRHNIASTGLFVVFMFGFNRHLDIYFSPLGHSQ